MITDNLKRFREKMGGDPVFANTLKDLGVQWLQVGGDFEYMMKYAQQLYDQIRN